MGRRTSGRTLALVTPRWRPFASVRSRILGWSVLLLTVALAASTVAMHVFLVRQLDGRVNAELAHEIAEFRALEAQLGGAADGGSDGTAAANSVITLLRTRTSQAVLERDTVLIGLAGGRIVALSANTSPATIGASRALLANWSAVTALTGGTAQLGAGPARYLAVPAAGRPGRGASAASPLWPGGAHRAPPIDGPSRPIETLASPFTPPIPTMGFIEPSKTSRPSG